MKKLHSPSLPLQNGLGPLALHTAPIIELHNFEFARASRVPVRLGEHVCVAPFSAETRKTRVP